MSEENARREETVSVSVRVPKGMRKEIKDTAAELHLSDQDTIRLSLARGLLVLKKQLTTAPELPA